jgi:tert-butyl alcohol monooxygenase / tert-amyl alcohol desaturase
MDQAQKAAARQPYSAYYQRTVPGEDAELTHTGPNTVCGEFMRRFWQPVAMSCELKEKPYLIKVMGEELVAFRDLQGRVGVLNKHCSHRGTSLEYGEITDQGIRCCYHHWHFGIDGTVLETPGEPPTSKLKTTLCHGAYPAFEMHGLVFAYMGPPELKPAFPIYDTYDTPDNEILAFSNYYPCNWLQVQENIADPMHACFLHSMKQGSSATLQQDFAVHPELEYLETDNGQGMLWIGSRRVGDEVWVRSDHFLLPNFVQIPALFDPPRAETLFQRVAMTRWVVPIDDKHCWIFGWRHFNKRVDPNGKGNRSKVGRDSTDFLAGQTGDRPYDVQQEEPGDWEAIISQRPIAIHALEHMGATDVGVAMYRRLLRRAIKAHANGQLVLRSANGKGLPTYTQDTVFHIPRQSNGDDRKLVRKVGRRILDVVFEGDLYSGDERTAFITSKLRRIPEEVQTGATD